MIYVELDNEDDAYQVFETLNTRGKDLATADLLKNHLARLLREKNSLSDDVKVRWSMMSDNIKAIAAEGVDLDAFLHHYWLARNSFVQKRTLFKTAKESVKTKKDAKLLLDDLLSFSEIYKHLHEPGTRKWKNEELDIKAAMESINKFRVRHPLPLMMIALHKYEQNTLSKSEIVSLFQVIELFTFINTSLMNTRSSGGVAKMYALHAKTLGSSTEPNRRKKAIGGFVAKIAAKLPTETDFTANFKKLKYPDKFPTQKREIQYVVTKLFAWMFPAVAVNPNEMSIEHIEPQSSTALAETHVASIGNLWFLRTAFNKELGNAAAIDKLTQYKASQLPCDETLKNATSWGATEIEQRTTELADRIWQMVVKRFDLAH